VDDQVQTAADARATLVEGAQDFERVSGAVVSGQSGLGSGARRNQPHLRIDGSVQDNAHQSRSGINRPEEVGTWCGGIRAAGAGRRKAEEGDKQLRGELTRIVEETTAGNPMSAVPWTNKSTQAIAAELTQRGHAISERTVA